MLLKPVPDRASRNASEKKGRDTTADNQTLNTNLNQGCFERGSYRMQEYRLFYNTLHIRRHVTCYAAAIMLKPFLVLPPGTLQ